MKALLAVLSVAFFQLIYIDIPRGEGIVGYVLYQIPPLGLLVGVFMSMMAGPCFGKQTPLKRRLSVLGAGILLSLWFIASLTMGATRGLTFFTSIPFLATCVPLLILRLREDPEKEAAARKAQHQEEERRVEEIRSTLARKPNSLS